MTALRLLVPGGGATLQDRGRPGYQRFGVAESGAMDRLSLALANRLVGNPPDEACIEFALVGGTALALDGDVRVAMAGDADIRIDGEPVPPFSAALLRAGATLAVGRLRTGLYGYLAVAGGFDAPAVLGSRSTHARSGIGGGILKPGATLPLRTHAPPMPLLGLAPQHWPRADGPIRVVMGPQDDAFTQAGRAAFLAGDYRIGRSADRMGFRLEGPEIEHAAGFNIVSDGIVLGSIQVPGTRQPIVLLADRQSTGGYPKIATVIGADIRRLVQRGQTAPIRFVAVTADEAVAILRAQAAADEALLAHIGPVGAGDLFASERLLGLTLVDGFIAGAR